MKHKSFAQSFTKRALLIWLLLFSLLPMFLLFCASFLEAGDGQLFQWVFTLKNYAHLFDPLVGRIFLHSLLLACSTALLCLLIGYPVAYSIARLPVRTQNIALFFLIIPFWTSVLIRTYAMMTLLKAKGLINELLLWLGLIHAPLQLLYTKSAVLVGLVYTLLPFMVMPIFACLEKLNQQEWEAAGDLGATRYQVFWRVILPQSKGGIAGGMSLVFFPAMTLFYIPVLLGGARDLLLGNLIESQLLSMHDWPQAAATSVVLTGLMFLLIAGIQYSRVSKNTGTYL